MVGVIVLYGVTSFAFWGCLPFPHACFHSLFPSISFYSHVRVGLTASLFPCPIEGFGGYWMVRGIPYVGFYVQDLALILTGPVVGGVGLPSDRIRVPPCCSDHSVFTSAALAIQPFSAGLCIFGLGLVAVVSQPSFHSHGVGSPGCFHSFLGWSVYYIPIIHRYALCFPPHVGLSLFQVESPLVVFCLWALPGCLSFRNCCVVFPRPLISFLPLFCWPSLLQDLVAHSCLYSNFFCLGLLLLGSSGFWSGC